MAMASPDAQIPPPEVAPEEHPAPDLEASEASGSEAAEPGDEWLDELPESIIAWLARSIGTRELWDWLGDDERGNLRLVLLSGFRATPPNLRQPAVAKRLVKHCATHRDILRGLVDLWRPHHAALFDAIGERDDESLGQILPALLATHGGEALLLALAANGRSKALDELENLDPDATPNEAATGDAGADAVDGSESSVEAQPAPDATALQAALDDAREREARLRAALAAAQEKFEKERDKVLAKAREADRELKSTQNRAQVLEAERNEARRLLDRSERRGRHADKERETFEADNKRLRRQMRRQQEISEEIRKQLARANSELEELRPKAPDSTATTAGASTSPPPASTSGDSRAQKSASPLDREYVLAADRRKISVTPREVQKRVDANDEEWVFRLIQALESIRQVDPGGHKTFLDALKPLGYYYRQVLTSDTLRVLVDASNVARYEKDERNKGKLSHLLEMRDVLRSRGCFPIKIIADASLPYFIDDSDALVAMARRGEVEMSNSGQEADEILAREARRTGAYVVTNDRAFFQKATPDFEPPRITFRVVAGMLIVDEF
jgi:predicted  nucleic acid-binding Zn-ribbon protein